MNIDRLRDMFSLSCRVDDCDGTLTREDDSIISHDAIIKCKTCTRRHFIVNGKLVAEEDDS